MDEIAKRLTLILEALPIVAALLVAKVVVETFGLDVISINPVITAFASSIIFIMAFIFAGKLLEYKERTQTLGQLAASIKALSS